MPEAGDILGLKPRYHLRSGYAGLQINNDMDKVMTINDIFFFKQAFKFCITSFFHLFLFDITFTRGFNSIIDILMNK